MRPVRAVGGRAVHAPCELLTECVCVAAVAVLMGAAGVYVHAFTHLWTVLLFAAPWTIYAGVVARPAWREAAMLWRPMSVGRPFSGEQRSVRGGPWR